MASSQYLQGAGIQTRADGVSIPVLWGRELRPPASSPARRARDQARALWAPIHTLSLRLPPAQDVVVSLAGHQGQPLRSRLKEARSS